MKPVFAMLGIVLALSACGADGEPVRPALNTSVSISNQGVSANAGLSVSQGPFTLGVSL